MTWDDLFERATSYEITLPEIREAVEHERNHPREHESERTASGEDDG